MKGMHLRKLNEDQVIDIYTSELSHSKIAKKYKISISTAYRIRAGKYWKHLTKDLKNKYEQKDSLNI